MSALTESPRWRWLPGMQVTGPFAGVIRIQDDRFGMWGDPDPACEPVLDDPATIGCIEHLAREAWGKRGQTVSLEETPHGWFAHVHRVTSANAATVAGDCDSRGEAWAAALLAAPD